MLIPDMGQTASDEGDTRWTVTLMLEMVRKEGRRVGRRVRRGCGKPENGRRFYEVLAWVVLILRGVEGGIRNGSSP